MTQLVEQGWESYDHPGGTEQNTHLCPAQSETGTWYTFQEGTTLETGREDAAASGKVIFVIKWPPEGNDDLH